jgi:adenosylcobyric acid synthase
MGLAEAVDTDVLLVGDVDKGGVFAAIYGTFMLLEPEERKRVKGYIINKFRGDVSLLMPGVEMLSEKIGIPCMGVLPFIHDLGIDDEDSVSDRLASKRREASTASEQVEVGVIRLPYLSNFTDFTSLEQMGDVNLSYLDRPSDAEFCDLLIIPGSKSTVHDMQFLAESGFNEAIYKAHRRGTAIMGICGGFQMLGTEISDPKGVESGAKSINGLGILPVKTVMASEKQTVQCTGTLAGAFVGEETARSPVSGYEIHMGRTEWMTEDEKGQASMRPAIIKADGMPDGCMDRSGQVMGTYLHGIFDSDAFRNDLIRALRYKKGLHTDFSETAYAAQKESAYDRLTAIFERHLDRAAIASVLEASRPTP